MYRSLKLAFVFSFFIAGGVYAQEQASVYSSTHHDYQAVPVVEGLDRPWGMAFLPNGDMLVTEKGGTLRIVRDGQVLETPVSGVPEVSTQGQGGLLDVVVHPDFESNQMVYLSYSKPVEDGWGTTTIARGQYENGALSNVEELFEANSRGRGHYGSRIVFDGEGYVFFSVGDRQARPDGDLAAHPAQDLTNHHGTINRIHEDGRIPEDNPFVDTEGAEPTVWSYGHRNPQGMAMHPETGDLWANEHGPQGGDELNLVQPGLNYGWPVIGYGVNYRSGAKIHDATHMEGMEQPKHFWVPSIGISGLMIYTGDKFPEWHGSAFSGGLSGQQLSRLTMDEQDVVVEETLYYDMGRIRDVRQGPDGFIYLALDHGEEGMPSIVRLEPAEVQ